MTSIKSFFAKIFAAHVTKKINTWASKPIETQEKVFKSLIASAKHTTFGKDHHFSSIKNHEDFVKKVPVRDYENLKSYVNQVVDGKSDILWPGTPLYFAKTSGTTSGAKYIPITAPSIKAQVEASRNAILMYINETGNSGFVDGKWIFLQGSPVLSEKNGIKLGRLSGISAHYVPSYLLKNRMPTWETNCIEDWETKVDAIVQETLKENMTAIAGIPSWVQMYFEKLVQEKHQKVGEIFKDFNLFSQKIDESLQNQNSYYKDLIQGKVLMQLKITQVQKDGFKTYMKTIGKLGGQNKTPRLANDRKIADSLKKHNLIK